MDTCVTDLGDGSVMCPNCLLAISEVKVEEDEIPIGTVLVGSLGDLLMETRGYIECFCPECGGFVRFN